MNIDEVVSWRAFVDTKGNVFDLSHLDAHYVTYVHSAEGCKDISYKFIVSYSFHCFTKDYPHLSEDDIKSLMYYAKKDNRPFCVRRYELSKQHLKYIVENLGTSTVKIFHAGYSSYATTKIINTENQEEWYMVPFKVFKENKKYRIHITSAYPSTVDDGKKKQKVGFFKIACNLRAGKKLPAPKK